MIEFKECIERLQTLFPLPLAEDWDNVGLLVDREGKDIKRVLLTLGVDEKVVSEAVALDIDLIISHHPLFFQLKGIDGSRREGKLLRELIKNDVALYVMHTNFDNHPQGLNHHLGKILGLTELEVLSPGETEFVKLEFYVPKENEGEVLKPLYELGGGKLGNYDSCSFTVKGFGSFRSLEGANPYIGRFGEKEIVEEVKVEMIFPEDKVEEGIRALKRHHPYETVAYQVLSCVGKDPFNGLGVVGQLDRSMQVADYLKIVGKRLGKPFIEMTKGCQEKEVRRVAVCGGAGKSLLPLAMKKSDLYLSGDFTYHDFELAAHYGFPIGDIGHFEGERIAFESIKGMLEEVLETEILLSEEDNHKDIIRW